MVASQRNHQKTIGAIRPTVDVIEYALQYMQLHMSSKKHRRVRYFQTI
ncbi:hypothetical protein NITUZ_40013 [Candidatus Nitrosotenuis uzonensis]|uniref:Uncharacterized protein n=1 Tax=Candidatus Nitrosotenuis uzonensis TaxID=1407055 RepID=V6AT69_9ARCH|nr:hypothetical protein NITUZ_40013 [Candidatus Nitrosotenuis uzonensis]